MPLIVHFHLFGRNNVVENGVDWQKSHLGVKKTNEMLFQGANQEKNNMRVLYEDI